MKALVTGAGGFLGRHVARALLARGVAVRGLDLAFDPAPPAGVEPMIGSILDPAALAAAAAGVDAVVHAAAIAHLWTRDADDYERVNVAGTEAVLRAAAAAGARRAAHVSSYVTTITGGRGAPERRIDESDAAAEAEMLGPYPRSKWRAEARARALAEELGLETAILLPSAPIGAEDHRLTPPSKMLLDLANGALPATLDCRLNLVAAEAVAEGIAAAVGGPAVGWGRPWRRFLLTGEDLEMDDYLALVGRVSGVAPPRAKAPYLVALAAAQVEARISALTGRAPSAPLTGVRLAGPKLRFDAGRAGAELGFAPPPLETALRAALGWMREAGLTRRPLPGLGA